MDKSNSFCVKKSYFLFGLLIVLVGVLLFFSKNLTNTKISYNSRASASKFPSYSFKAYFWIVDDSDKLVYDGQTGYGGLTDLKNTIILKPQKQYTIYMYNTSTDPAIENLFGAIVSNNGNSGILSKTFSFSLPGANFEQGFDGMWGTGVFSYDHSGNYQISGVFRPMINGRQQILYPPTLNVIVRATDKNPSLKAYFEVQDLNNTTIFNGLTNQTNKVTLLPQGEYLITIKNNSTDPKINNLPGSNTDESYRLFTLTAPGATTILGPYDGMAGYWELSYSKSGTYQISGVFRPTINGKQQLLYPPPLTVVVTPEYDSLRAYFTVEDPNLPSSSSFSQFLPITSDTITLGTQKSYLVCIRNNSSNLEIRHLYKRNPYQPENLKPFSLTASGSTGAIQGGYDGIYAGCWYPLKYNTAGRYQITGVFRPTINGKQQLLYPPPLNVTVKLVSNY